ncbi:MAG: isoprenylcysteine carboxylmethyltransferase family protein [Candidatus Dormiibacterota bacterium]
MLVDIVASLMQRTGGALANPRIISGGVGVALAVMAIIAGTVGRITMGASWRTSADGAQAGVLVTTGPFAAVRHPVYASMLVLALAVVFLVPNVWTAIAFVIATAGLEVQVRAVEEPRLRARFGGAYARYAATTGRFVPLVGQLR